LLSGGARENFAPLSKTCGTDLPVFLITKFLKKYPFSFTWENTLIRLFQSTFFAPKFPNSLLFKGIVKTSDSKMALRITPVTLCFCREKLEVNKELKFIGRTGESRITLENPLVDAPGAFMMTISLKLISRFSKRIVNDPSCLSNSKK